MTNTSLKDFFLNINSRFKYYDFDTIFDILLAQSQKEAKSSKKPVVYIIAGPNGSGKSTLVTKSVAICLVFILLRYNSAKKSVHASRGVLQNVGQFHKVTHYYQQIEKNDQIEKSGSGGLKILGILH